MPTSSREVLRSFAPTVPAALADRAEAWSAADRPAPPRASASVVLVRDTRSASSGVEVFLLHRHARMAFAASMAVFPGGGLEPGDIEPEPLRACAVRETEEETGVRLHPDRLWPWAHWTTPEPEPRRYETTFYLAELPVGQRARDASTETDRAAWTTPRAALGAYARGELGLMPPTASILTELAGALDVAGLLTAAKDRVVEPVLPRLRRTATGWAYDYGLGPDPDGSPAC